MARYMVLYNATPAARQAAMRASREEVEASMARWIAWRDEAAKTVTVEFNLPMRPIANISARGASESDTTVTGSATLEGDRDAIVELLKTHPHLQTPGASIDLLELIPLDRM